MKALPFNVIFEYVAIKLVLFSRYLRFYVAQIGKHGFKFCVVNTFN